MFVIYLRLQSIKTLRMLKRKRRHRTFPHHDTLRDTLIYYLEKRGIKKSWLAEKIGVQPSDVTRKLKGEIRISEAQCVLIIETLGKEFEVLFNSAKRKKNAILNSNQVTVVPNIV